MRAELCVAIVWLAAMSGGFAGAGAKDQAPAKRTVAPRAVCEVHGIEMQRVQVPLVMGLPDARWWDDPRMRRAERFPHSALRAFGGCCIEGDEPKTVGVFHCADCLHGAFLWEIAHRAKGNRPPPIAPPAHRAIGREVANRLALGVR